MTLGNSVARAGANGRHPRGKLWARNNTILFQ